MVASVWMHKDGIDQTMNQVMTPSQQQFEKPFLCTASLSVWKKSVFMHRNTMDSLRSSRPISRTVTYAVIATFIERSPHKSVQKQPAELGVLHLTMFDHKRDLVKLFWPVFVTELRDTDMKLCHKACALLLE